MIVFGILIRNKDQIFKYASQTVRIRAPIVRNKLKILKGVTEVKNFNNRLYWVVHNKPLAIMTRLEQGRLLRWHFLPHGPLNTLHLSFSILHLAFSRSAFLIAIQNLYLSLYQCLKHLHKIARTSMIHHVLKVNITTYKFTKHPKN